MRNLSRVLGWSSRAVAILLLALLAAPFAWQAVTGDRFLTVTGVSMTPTIQLGDVLVVRSPQGDELRTRGQIVVARFDGKADGALYVHRVWQTTEAGAILKGDGNEVPDPRTITQSEVVGTPRAHFAGAAAALLKTSQDLVARIALVAIALTLCFGIPALLRPLTRRERAASDNSRSAQVLRRDLKEEAWS